MVGGDMERDKPQATKAAVKPRKKTAQAPARPAKMRGGEARGIADLIPAIGETSFRRFGFVQSSLVSRWAEIAGPRYAAMASPESIAFPRGKKGEGTLHLVVTSATAIFMQHAEPEIITRVNRFFGYEAVARVKYRHGALARPLRPEPRAVTAPSLKPIAITPADGLKPIGDPELQTVLESLARSMAEKEAREAAAMAPARAAPVQLKSDNLKPVRLFALPPLPSDEAH
ncbi:DUF721 domain-containing protein [Blastomonas aquatica]|uniref:RNA-binding protein n=1 Tax=Blastomonas aquatica TaxID=1510276 RepID=A0ABQ1JRF9_9SPHN|nr:DUF721 domain-containing protein [Blastomonas aquatica]GGB75393.1 hypothetical protein GCM10010833_33290 [Blastomonas aquatica]